MGTGVWQQAACNAGIIPVLWPVGVTCRLHKTPSLNPCCFCCRGKETTVLQRSCQNILLREAMETSSEVHLVLDDSRSSCRSQQNAAT